MPTAVPPFPPARISTGIAGLDQMTGGGFPRGRTTLVSGGPGSGKTLLTLQGLVHGARVDGEPGAFVAFEERADRILANAASFGWDMPALQPDGLWLLDARPPYQAVVSGAFDLGGLLAMLDARVSELGIRRIVFDALDTVLDLMEDRSTVRREVHRLHDWLLDRGLTAFITHKPERREGADHLDFMQFMVDCAVEMGIGVVDGIAQRHVRIIKYRGSAFDENERPLVIGRAGVEVARLPDPSDHTRPASTERVSTGVDRLDTMLDGGYFRGASVLISGSPGTAKTTLAAAFTQAACRRGERSVYVSFDSPNADLLRNMQSVGIDLGGFVDSGQLHLMAAYAIHGSAEMNCLRIQEKARDAGARCVVIDPISAFAKLSPLRLTTGVLERLVLWARAEGITLLCTSLLSDGDPMRESTREHISTIADTWIHLSYVVHAGERNRALTVVKSRGVNHSNQVRELVLSAAGPGLNEVYTAGGEVLMGTLRWEKERAERLQREADDAETARRKHLLALELAELEARMASLRRELETRRTEALNLERTTSARTSERISADDELRELRRADAPDAGRTPSE